MVKQSVLSISSVAFTAGFVVKNVLLLLICITVFSGIASAQAIFPQFADGKFSDGTYYKSTIVIQSQDTIQTQSCTLRVYGRSGQHFTSGVGQAFVTDSSGQLSFLLGSLNYQVLQSTGTDPISTGYAYLSCDGVDWTAYILFTYYSATGVKLSEATVFESYSEDSGNAGIAQLIVDQREGARLGIAMVNTSNLLGQYTLTVKDQRFTLAGTAAIVLQPNVSTSKFLDELVSLPANFVGQVTIAPKQQFAGPSIYALGLRFTGALFTTIPVSKCYGGIFCD